MNGRQYHNLVWVPIFLVGLIALAVGITYFTIGEPWLLDKKANELLLTVSFKDLLSKGINSELHLYLSLLYRFFGLWLGSVGFLIVLYVLVTKMGTALARNSLHSALLFVVAGIYYVEFSFIPTTPFIWLTHIITFLLIVSIYGSIKIKKYDNL
tara:strand:+ start:3583 stop:4044 length:462 start_codon:yes stop_codon:yes gene_type:complete